MRTRFVGIALLLVATAHAQDATPKQAARAVLEAYNAKDEETLATLAARDRPDPWLVADELCFRQVHDAAAAFAKAAPRKDTEKLSLYVASQRGKPQGLAARTTALAAARAFQARRVAEALRLLDTIDTTVESVFSVRILSYRGQILRAAGKMTESTAAFAAAADLAEKIGWLKHACEALNEASRSAYFGSERLQALPLLERALAVAEARGNKKAIADTLANIGVNYTGRGEYEKALAYQRRALAMTDDPRDRAITILSLAGIHSRLGAVDKAIELRQQAIALLEKTTDRRTMAMALMDLGMTYRNRGDFARALAHLERAHTMAHELKDRYVLSRTFGNLAALHSSRGEFAKAFAAYEQARRLMAALGDQAGAAGVLSNVGKLHERLGNDQKALACAQRALELHRRLGDRPAMARDLRDIGDLLGKLDRYDQALAHLQKALALTEQLNEPSGLAACYSVIANLHYRRKEYDEAIAHHRRALAIGEKLQDRFLVAGVLGNIAVVHGARGESEKAIELFERMRATAIELGALHLELTAIAGIAGNHRAARNLAESVRFAREGVEKLPLVIGGLGDEQGAQARDEWEKLLETGIRSSGTLEDLDAFTFFVESGRAGALLESLGGRDALAAATIPDALREEGRRAREAVARAQARLGRAFEARSFKAARVARKELDRAREAQLEIVARIQRSAKAGADVTYPRAATLAEIQACLADDEAFVAYVFVSDGTAALVATRKEARMELLAVRKPLEDAVATLDLQDGETDWSQVIGVLRDAVFDPLKLDETVRRVLVSPAGALSYLPFTVLAPDKEFVYVPSGTTYRMLLAERDKRGEKVLALGDPIYETKRRGSIHRAKLEPLPGTRDEVRAIGDVVLLADRATEAGLREALGKTERWRAVHLACHGLVSTTEPTLSALAVSVAAPDDGFLTVLEVFKMRIPADLAVLSACETAKGKVYRAEGVIGFTRAFMMAGAPRVVVSLWQVDDDATRALMVKFYELWKTEPAATALAKAQAFVASHEKWSHPKYWAAWQLWGLP